MNAWESKRRSHDAAIYLFGALEREIQIYARSNGLSPRELARNVAELFLTQTLGEVLGPTDNLPTLRRNGTAGNQPVEQVEVARGAHRGTQVKPHWTQRPENRKKMMRNVTAMTGDSNKRIITKKQLAAMRRKAMKGRAALAARVRKERLAQLRRRQEQA